MMEREQLARRIIRLKDRATAVAGWERRLGVWVQLAVLLAVGLTAYKVWPGRAQPELPPWPTVVLVTLLPSAILIGIWLLNAYRWRVRARAGRLEARYAAGEDA